MLDKKMIQYRWLLLWVWRCLFLFLVRSDGTRRRSVVDAFYVPSSFSVSRLSSPTTNTTTPSIPSLLSKRKAPIHSQTKIFSSDNNNNKDSDSHTDTSQASSRLKQDLIQALTHLRQLQERDGDFSNIDWGSKGGELTETGRVPRTVDYSWISDDVGKAADQVFDICQRLEQENPTLIPTQYLGDPQKGDQAPLNGTWQLLFTNAADAVFSKDSKRGAAKAQNVVNAKKGKITNVITFLPDTNGTTPNLQQLQVIIRAIALNQQRVQLNFQYAKVVLRRLFGLKPLFGKPNWNLYIPVPALFVTTVLNVLRKIKRLVLFWKKTSDKDEEKRSTQGYFDVVYLDDQLRIHKTGQGNLFVQTKQNAWPDAQPLIR